MKNTLILYESLSKSIEKIAMELTLILGPARHCKFKDFQKYYDKFDFIVIITSEEEYIDEHLLRFLLDNINYFKTKKIVILHQDLGEGGNKQNLLGFKNILGDNLIYFNNIDVEESINIALEIKKLKDNSIKEIGKETLKREIEKFLKEHNTCTISTGYNGEVRGTPIEYMYKEGYIYILTEGGEKFANILRNNNVSISIYNNYLNMSKLAGMQIQGKAKIIPHFSDKYKEVINMKGISYDAIKNLPIIMNVLSVKIIKVEFLYSKFKEEGFDAKQIFHYK